MFELSEYLPTAHLVHEAPPPSRPLSVIDPAGQALQLISLPEPSAPLYLPASQRVQAATFEAVEYLPTAHIVHAVAPLATPVLVIEPAAQSAHNESVESTENLPAAQSVQLVAPGAVPVFVIEPAWQSKQYDCEVELESFPLGHSSHLALFKPLWE